MTKSCNRRKCAQANPQLLAEFNRNKRMSDGLQATCRSCSKKYYDNNKDEHNLRSKNWRKSNPEKNKLHNAVWVRNNPQKRKGTQIRRYWPNLSAPESMVEYNKLLQTQNGLCAICKRPEHIRHGDKLKDLSVDHDHDTGKVRGLLCHDCNIMIGIAREDSAVLNSAIAYLDLAK